MISVHLSSQCTSNTYHKALDKSWVLHKCWVLDTSRGQGNLYLQKPGPGHMLGEIMCCLLGNASTTMQYTQLSLKMVSESQPDQIGSIKTIHDTQYALSSLFGQTSFIHNRHYIFSRSSYTNNVNLMQQLPYANASAG